MGDFQGENAKILIFFMFQFFLKKSNSSFFLMPLHGRDFMLFLFLSKLQFQQGPRQYSKNDTKIQCIFRIAQKYSTDRNPLGPYIDKETLSIEVLKKHKPLRQYFFRKYLFGFLHCKKKKILQYIKIQIFYHVVDRLFFNVS